MLKHLAIDIGASSGRHILGMVQNGQITLQEVHRFENRTLMKNGRLIWDTQHLFFEIITGLIKCREAGFVPDTLGIDTWAVDYALLDQDDQLIGDIAAYRDNRTQGMDQRLEQTLPFSAHYSRCGIAKQPFNTVYQLMSEDKNTLQNAHTFLMMPDYLHFLLTGLKVNEYTNLSTTALLNAHTLLWDQFILKAAGLNPALFSAPLLHPAVPLGPLKKEIADKVGFHATVVLPATHDTGSAFMAVPAKDENAVYLSSGTWSLLGVENPSPILSGAALEAGFTNEGGYGGKIRLLKNIMGLWILQSLRREWEKRYSFSEMAEMALKGESYPGVFDANATRFLSPQSMLGEVNAALLENGYPPPKDDCELLYAVYQSLVVCYRDAVRGLKRLTGRNYTSLNIVGGGSQNAVLNQMIADGLKLPVYAGPAEGTALGNIIAQLIASGEIPSLKMAREMIRQSFDIQTFTPKEA